jgi:pimeloyl-ACP methyl ester carboxylesterase
MQRTLNGEKLAFDDFGTGPAVVLIHGFPLNRQMWAPQVEPLVDAGFRVILPDLRGFGDSAGDANGSMDRYADDIIVLLDYLGVDRAVIGGMSMGGYVLLNLLERYYERLSAALFIVTRAAADDDTGRAKRDNLIAAVQRGNAQLVAATFAGLVFAPQTAQRHPQLPVKVRSWMDAISADGLIAALRAMRDRRDSVAMLPDYHLPALVISASDDQAMPLEHYQTLCHDLPHAECALLADAGHMVNLEQPEAFNRTLLAFLQRYGG